MCPFKMNFVEAQIHFRFLNIKFCVDSKAQSHI